MDTKKLVVGQDVFVFSGIYYSDCKVVKVTPEGAEVFIARNPLPRPDNVIWQFDTKGESLNGVGTAEYGPYIIDDMPFEERKADLLDVARRRELFRIAMNKKYPVGSVLSADEPLPQSLPEAVELCNKLWDRTTIGGRE